MNSDNAEIYSMNLKPQGYKKTHSEKGQMKVGVRWQWYSKEPQNTHKWLGPEIEESPQGEFRETRHFLDCDQTYNASSIIKNICTF